MGDQLVVPGESAGEGSAPVRVFMSYRRADDHNFIGRLHDRLCAAFGDDMVFRDIDSIPAGTNFRAVILRTLNEVDAVVAVIGPRWVRQEGDGGSDYVYLELAEALKQGKQVIPVLMEKTSMPTPDVLPSDLRPLTEINAISVHADPAFRRDSGRLIDTIRDVVTRDRARIVEARLAAEELARRVDEERHERERLAEALRAEERAARMRLAELEEAASRRQIELENARLADIAERLRLAEAVETTTPPDQADQAEQPAVVEARQPAPAPVVDPQTATAPAEPRAASRTSSALVAEQRPLQALIVAATVFGVIALFRNRSVETPFSELSYGRTVDACVWILTLAVAVPLSLGHRPVDQRFVLIGVAASAFFFEFLQASAIVRYGTTRYDEGSWLVLKVLQTVCLVAAIWIVRHRASGSLPSSARVRVVLVALATACAALVVAALHDQWRNAGILVESGFLKDRTPFAVWLVFLVLGPAGLTIGLATRPSYGSRVALATIATLGAVGYLAEALVGDELFGVDGSLWQLTAVAHMVLAAVAWWSVAASIRRDDPALLFDAA